VSIKRVQKQWSAFGAQNPMWAVLTSQEQWSPESFYATGVAEIAGVVRSLSGHGLNPQPGRALDFGCGAGRLSQALAGHFQQVVGVDISPAMVSTANTNNRFPDRVTYLLNQRDDLRQLGDASFDMIYSNITLQHMDPRHASRYLREFVRLLAPAGALVFQLPSDLITRNPLKRVLKALLPDRLLLTQRRLSYAVQSVRSKEPIMEMYGIKRAAVLRLIAQAGARMVAVEHDTSETANEHWVCYRYFVTK
jgi:ubiquinone/menaquinone biosynthesis C-methylase UbiE